MTAAHIAAATPRPEVEQTNIGVALRAKSGVEVATGGGAEELAGSGGHEAALADRASHLLR